MGWEPEGSRTACDLASWLPAGEPRGSGGRGLVLLLCPAVPVVLAPVHGLGLRLSPWQVCVQQLRPGDSGQVPSQGREQPRGPGGAGYPRSAGKREKFLSPSFPLKFSLEVVGFQSKTDQSRATPAVGKRKGRNLTISRVSAKQLLCDRSGSADTPPGCTGVSRHLVEERKWRNPFTPSEVQSCLILSTEPRAR